MRRAAASNHLMRTQRAGRSVERCDFHRTGVPASVLPEVSRLLRLLPALGARQLPHADPGRDRALNAAGVVAALAAEARVLGPARRAGRGLAVLADGNALGGERHGHAAAARSARHGASSTPAPRALVSWGLAGGLDPDPRGGRRVRAARGHRRRRQPSSRPRAPGASRSRPPFLRAVASAVTRLLTSRARARDRGRTRAPRVARPAPAPSTWKARRSRKWPRPHGLPFIAVRVIVDTARDGVPQAVAGASRAGKLRIGRLILGLMRSPRRSPRSCAWRDATASALRSLRAVASLGELEPPVDAAAALRGASRMRALVTGATGLRGRRGGAGVAARRAGRCARWRARVPTAAISQSLPLEIAVGDLNDPRLARAGDRRLPRAVSRRGGLSARRARPAAALPDQRRGNAQHPGGGAARGRRAQRLHLSVATDRAYRSTAHPATRRRPSRSMP